MADYKSTLAKLIEAAPDDLTPEMLGELSAMAAKMTNAPAPPKPVARINPRQTAREQFAALPPLPPGASDAQKLQRASEQAKLLTTITGMRGDETNGTTWIEPDPEAA